MGKLILCSSVIAKNPYCFPMTKTKVYSIEEVCYYIRNNIYMMQEEVFDRGFADWIRGELGMVLEEQAIINILKVNPATNQEEIAKQINKSVRTVKTYMAEMQEKGLIERKNGKKNGEWVVNG